MAARVRPRREASICLTLVPPGALPSEEAINAKYGPTFGGYAQAICEAMAKLR